MKIYRAMCDKELKATRKLGYPVFLKSSKWFSSDPNHICKRVMGRGFNQSSVESGNYKNLCEFEIEDEKYLIAQNDMELRLNKENQWKVKFIQEVNTKWSYNLNCLIAEI